MKSFQQGKNYLMEFSADWFQQNAIDFSQKENFQGKYEIRRIMTNFPVQKKNKEKRKNSLDIRQYSGFFHLRIANWR